MSDGQIKGSTCDFRRPFCLQKTWNAEDQAFLDAIIEIF